jgi:hypothetical protein
MGNFRIEIDACGGHGCGREVKEGETLKPCGSPSCPDCMARALVDDMKAKGMFGYPPSAKATLTHRPDGPGTVVDDLLAGVRKKGSF